MKICLVELHYLPNIHYFSTVAAFDTLTIEKNEYFVKQSYRSRCAINTAQGVRTLSIPLTGKHTGPEGKTYITDIQIDYSQKWLNNHWRAIQSAYANAPFFEHYAADLHNILFKKHGHLYELNWQLLTMCLKWLKLNLTVKESLTYEKAAPADTQDLRNAISVKNQPLIDKVLSGKPYTQVFGNTFVNNLSIIDLVFCTGPKALTYLQAPV